MSEMLTFEPWARLYKATATCLWGGGIVILLSQRRGVGKTQLAVAVARYFCKNGRSAKYIRAAQMFMAMRGAFRDGSKVTEESALQEFVRPHLLIVDEAQVRRQNEYEAMQLTILQDLRYGEGRPTLWLANCDKPMFRDQIGESVWDRMGENGFCELIQWPGFRAKGVADGEGS